MTELPILRNRAGRVIRVMGEPDGPIHFALIQNGMVIRTKPIKGRAPMPDFEDTMPTQPAALDEPRYTGRHNYPPPDWELKWTKRLLFMSIVVAIGAVLLAIVA